MSVCFWSHRASSPAPDLSRDPGWETSPLCTRGAAPSVAPLDQQQGGSREGSRVRTPAFPFSSWVTSADSSLYTYALLSTPLLGSLISAPLLAFLLLLHIVSLSSPVSKILSSFLSPHWSSSPDKTKPLSHSWKPSLLYYFIFHFSLFSPDSLCVAGGRTLLQSKGLCRTQLWHFTLSGNRPLFFFLTQTKGEDLVPGSHAPDTLLKSG